MHLFYVIWQKREKPSLCAWDCYVRCHDFFWTVGLNYSSLGIFNWQGYFRIKSPVWDSIKTEPTYKILLLLGNFYFVLIETHAELISRTHQLLLHSMSLIRCQISQIHCTVEKDWYSYNWVLPTFTFFRNSLFKLNTFPYTFYYHIKKLTRIEERTRTQKSHNHTITFSASNY